MHGLPYINKSNFERANLEAAKTVTESGVLYAEQNAKFEKEAAEATARIGAGSAN